MTNGNEPKQLTAGKKLVALGAEIVDPLMIELQRAKYELVTHNLNGFIQNAIWVMTEIAQNKPNENRHLWCSRCMVHCQWHEAVIDFVITKSDSWEKIHETFTYYGCRICQNSRELFAFKGRMIAVLDNHMIEEQTETDQEMHLNWLKRRSVFDFDRVDIIQADDERVERFVVQVGNDTDPWRRPRYKEMLCQIDTHCHLSENTIRILKNTFGEVRKLDLNS